jgi:recombination protein RecA
LDVRRIGQIKDANDVTGNRVKVKVVKNKVAAPFREAEFDIIFNEGVSILGEIIDIGSDKGIVDKAGAWFSYKGERLGQGREGSKQFLRENPEMAKEIRTLILDSCAAGATPRQLGEANNEDLAAPEKATKGKKKAVANG